MLVRFVCLVFLVIPFQFFCGADRSQAATVHWTVQSAQSHLTVTGTATLSTTTLTLSPQATNSNVSPITGTLDTNLILGSSVDVTATNLSLVNNGSWSPLPGGALGTAPADLGLQAIFTKVAGRNMTIALDTPALTLTGGPSLYTFGVTGTTTLTGGTLDYNISIPPAFGGPVTAAAQSSDFVGSNGPITGVGGTISIAGGVATLTIPFTATNVPVTVDDFNTPSTADDLTGLLNLSGVLVATANVPEPSTVLLALSGGVALLCWRSRRQLVGLA